jgi:hypothetical protein
VRVAPRRSHARTGPRLLAVLLSSTLSADGCGSDSGRSADPADVVDGSSLRAMVSACLGIDAAASATFFFDARYGSGGADNAIRQCVARATDCRAVLACGGISDDPCDGEQHCDGTVAVSCVNVSPGLSRRQVRDCAADTNGNQTCSTLGDEKEGLWATCHAAECTTSRCDGDAYVECWDGVELRRDCREIAETCITIPETIFCGYRDTCTRDQCRDGEMWLCLSGRVQLKASCASLVPGSTCLDRNGAVECAAPHPHPDCEKATDFASWCEGGVAIACLSGIRVQAACDALPGGRCEPIDSAADLSKARCIMDGSPD